MLEVPVPVEALEVGADAGDVEVAASVDDGSPAEVDVPVAVVPVLVVEVPAEVVLVPVLGALAVVEVPVVLLSGVVVEVMAVAGVSAALLGAVATAPPEVVDVTGTGIIIISSSEEDLAGSGKVVNIGRGVEAVGTAGDLFSC